MTVAIAALLLGLLLLWMTLANPLLAIAAFVTLVWLGTLYLYVMLNAPDP